MGLISEDLIIAQGDIYTKYPWTDYEWMLTKIYNKVQRDGQEQKGYGWDPAHVEDTWFPAFLLTKDPKYLFPLQESLELYAHWRGQPLSKGYITFYNGRNFYCQVRTLAELAWAEREGYLLDRRYGPTGYQDILQGTLDKLWEDFDEYNDLYRCIVWNQATVNKGYRSSVGWFESYCAATISMVCRLGFTNWIELAKWHAEYFTRKYEWYGLQAMDNNSFRCDSLEPWNESPYKDKTAERMATLPLDKLPPYLLDGYRLTYPNRAHKCLMALQGYAEFVPGLEDLIMKLSTEVKRRDSTKDMFLKESVILL